MPPMTFQRLIHGASAEPKRTASFNCQSGRFPRQTLPPLGVAHKTPFEPHQTRGEY
jgi:hypothetical protein